MSGWWARLTSSTYSMTRGDSFEQDDGMIEAVNTFAADTQFGSR